MDCTCSYPAAERQIVMLPKHVGEFEATSIASHELVRAPPEHAEDNMSFVVTILEARVALERAADLQAAYAEAAAGPFPLGFVRSTLLQHSTDPEHWRIETVWQSHQALAAMRQAAGKPRGIQIFEAAGAQPSLSVFDTVMDLVPPERHTS